MSINSKKRRDDRKREAAKPSRAARTGMPIEPHAELRDAQGRLLGGIVRRDGEWTLGLGGRIAGASDSAARVLVMLRRAADLHERGGERVRLTCSAGLRVAVEDEVRALGVSFEEYEATLLEALTAGSAGDRPALH